MRLSFQRLAVQLYQIQPTKSSRNPTVLAVISLLFTIALSLVITRAGAIALTLTGISRRAADFQARSAFSGVGFTTSESESIVTHPVRRQIIMILMFIGHFGFATVAATIIASVMSAGENDSAVSLPLKILVLAGGILLLWLFSISTTFQNLLNHVIQHTLRRFTDLQVADYAAVLNLENGFAVTEAIISEDEWMEGQSLMQLQLSKEGVLVLGIDRPDAGYIGAPNS
ncbi:MAG: hypothetical protein AAFN70_13995, partial [Planctomycetota bacterium]